MRDWETLLRLLCRIDLVPGGALTAALAVSRQGGGSWGEALVTRLLAFLGSLARMGPPAPVLPSATNTPAHWALQCWELLPQLLQSDLYPLLCASLTSPDGLRLQRGMTTVLRRAEGQRQQRQQQGLLLPGAATAESVVLSAAGLIISLALFEHAHGVLNAAAPPAAAQVAAAQCAAWDAVAALPAAAALLTAASSRPAMSSQMHGALAMSVLLLISLGEQC